MPRPIFFVTPPCSSDQYAGVLVAIAAQPHNVVVVGSPYTVVVFTMQMSGQGRTMAAARLARERTVVRM